VPDAPPDRTPREVLGRGLGLLWRAVREQPRVFAVSAGGSAVYGLMTVGQAYVYGWVTDRAVVPAFADGRIRTGALTLGALLIVAVGAVKAGGILLRRLYAGIMQYRLQADYRRRVTRQYLRLPLSWHQRHPTGQLLSNANADVEASWHPIAPFPFAVGVVFMLVVALALLVVTDPVLALVGGLVFPAIAVLNVAYSRRLSPLMTRAQQLRAELSGLAHESFDGALVVKTLGREAAETQRFAAKADQLRDGLIRVGRVRAMFDPVMEALPNVGVIVVLLVGTLRIDAGAIGTGELVRVAYLFTLLAFPIRAIGWVLAELPRSVVGFDRVERVLAATGALPYGDRTLEGTGPARVAAAALRFGYDGHEVLHGVDLAVSPGRTVAVVGPTGAGKSTLTTLLVRLVDPTTGTVRLDGRDVRTLRPGEVSAAASLVPQTAFLFDDTVRGNVTLGADLPDEAVWAALRLAQADRFVAALPAGLDTVVGERGMTLSGGQRQRVALARALVRQPRLLVLDDATSSVDPQVEAAILAGLRTAALPASVLVVAYRRATIALADEVVYVEAGRVLGRGTHEQLLAGTPGYARLVTAYERAEAERRAARVAEEEPAA
jgi:ATP-binding cassette subfamily B protein